MVRAFFENEGHKCRLKYHKVETKEGELYQGILFLEKHIGFSYLKKKDKTIIFDNHFIGKYFQSLIVNVIENKEKRFKNK